jgi:hypothetical protein
VRAYIRGLARIGEKQAKRSGNQRTEIVEHVLENEEKRKLWEHGLPGRERHLPSAHAEGFSDRMEQEDLSKPVKKNIQTNPVMV